MEEEEAMYVPNMNVGCGLISHVSEPMHVKKSGKMFGFWGRDVGPDHKSVFYMEHFYKNTKVLRYRSLKAFVEVAFFLDYPNRRTKLRATDLRYRETLFRIL